MRTGLGAHGASSQKRYPAGYLFFAANLRSVAAAGAGQVLRRNRRAVSRQAAAPAVDGDAGVHVGGRQSGIGWTDWHHGDGAGGRRTEVLISHRYFAVDVRGDRADVLRS